MSAPTTYYKVLGGPTGRDPVHGGRGRWQARRWMPAVSPEPCVSGYHLCTLDQVLAWLVTAGAVWEAEGRGQVVKADNKSVHAQARLVRRLAWSPQIAACFAADCADRVLPLYERAYPGDSRPREAIIAARAWALGEISVWTAEAAAEAAGRAAWTAKAAGRAAAEAAGRAAAEAAGRTAAEAAAHVAEATERKWQTERLRQYLYGEVTPQQAAPELGS